MGSVVLSIATRFLLPLLLLFGVFLFLRGHDEPGGGFSGGLVVAVAAALYLVGVGLEAERRLLDVHPRTLVAAGLLVAAGSGLPGLLSGEAFLEARWLGPALPVLSGLGLGTPLLFDLGVLLTAAGAVLLALDALEEGG